MKIQIVIAVVVLLALLGGYLLIKGPLAKDKKYNWNLEVTKPLEYDMSLIGISYHKAGEEVTRYTTMNPFSGWSGMAAGRVLHNKATEYLPDSVKLSWKEINTDVTYALEFEFPKQQVIAYLDDNYDLLKQKWGSDYPRGQLSFKVGIAPDGFVTLWFSDMDVNTSGFALEVASFRAAVMDNSKNVQAHKTSPKPISNVRFGTPHFYTFTGENVVAIQVLYHNGEANSINLKNENGSVLEKINKKRGWAVAKEITVNWFDTQGKGYKSTYTVEINALPKDTLEYSLATQFIYLLDRLNVPDGEWNQLTDKHIIQLTEMKRQAIN